MKSPIPLLALLALAPMVPTHAAEPAPVVPEILGDLPDGTPPPSEPEKPAFVVAPQDVLETETHQQGGRAITVRKISPITLPQPSKPEPPSPANPALRQKLSAIEEENPGSGILFIGATVFRFNGPAPRTLASIQTEGSAEEVTFWSSADFAYLSGFSTFSGADGKTYSLIMAWGSTPAEQPAALEQEHGTPPLPVLAEGAATFSVITQNPSPEAVAAIQSLHQIYNSEYERLKAAFEGRERARLQQEADLRANPPQPKNLVLNHWRIETPVSEQQEERGDQ